MKEIKVKLRMDKWIWYGNYHLFIWIQKKIMNLQINK